jgi:hypothetical protein
MKIKRGRTALLQLVIKELTLNLPQLNNLKHQLKATTTKTKVPSRAAAIKEEE